MAAKLLKGKPIADAVKAEIAIEVANMIEGYGFAPCLVVVRVGDDSASEVYVRNKVKTSKELGIRSENVHLPSDVPESDLIAIVTGLNDRNDVDGILVQLPLPSHIDEKKILEIIDPAKDVDGFSPLNSGRLFQGHSALVPCTPAGVIEILKRSEIQIACRHAVVVGRSNIVGKPLAMLLLQENATVTICHSRTADLSKITRQADILIAAIGRAGFLREEHIGSDQDIVDVGINKVSDETFAQTLFRTEELVRRIETIRCRGFTLVGDVTPRVAQERAASFTPVPGGVGLMTIALLMANTVRAAKARRGIPT